MLVLHPGPAQHVHRVQRTAAPIGHGVITAAARGLEVRGLAPLVPSTREPTAEHTRPDAPTTATP